MDGEAVAIIPMKRAPTASIKVLLPPRRNEEGDVSNFLTMASSSGCNSYFSTIDIPVTLPASDTFPERLEEKKVRVKKRRVTAEWKKSLPRSYPLWNARPRRNSLERQCIFQFDEELDLPPLPRWQEAIDSDDDEDDGDDSDDTDLYKPTSSVSFEARRHGTPHFVTFLEKISRMYAEVYSTSEAGIVGSPRRSISRIRLKNAVYVNT